MNRISFLILAMMMSIMAMAVESVKVSSPDGMLTVTIDNVNNEAHYSVMYKEKVAIESSSLGLQTNIADFTRGLTLKNTKEEKKQSCYQMRGTKCSEVDKTYNELKAVWETNTGRHMVTTFRVGNNDVAFRYEFEQQGETACMTVINEVTAFRLPPNTKTFICPQSNAMVGWMRTKPSYEEEYVADGEMDVRSRYGQGYTFPCLFRSGDEDTLWVLISETGTNGHYVGCHLSDYDKEKGYTIAFPMAGEANGIGSTAAGMALPGCTPWRTITVGETLKPIVETTVSFDVVEPLYEAKYDYKPGRYTWSWLIWQDNSINFDDQMKFIDLAAAMGFEYCLVDNWWDKNIGRERIAQLSTYAQSRGVSLMLWYNSNGYENDAPQTPKQCMSTTLERRKEMAWLQSIGVKGVKVDFFAGDKQMTMQLYEDILADANDYGLQVVFHGCTLPRGWEKMYPNFVASEAVLASENTFFSEHHAQQEGFELTMHPFCRNTLAAMDWGGTIMNRYLAPDNKSRHRRYTSDIFELAAAVTIQTSVQCIAIQPNNLADVPAFELDFLRTVPSTWDETVFINGYPGRYVVIARRSGQRWIVAALNATDKVINVPLNLPQLAEKTVKIYRDKQLKKGALWPESEVKTIKMNKKGTEMITLQPMGGVVIDG
ncbi:MAG: glycoside hydrolase family 97 catalytic domain-containing protein [Prevotella sp.]